MAWSSTKAELMAAALRVSVAAVPELAAVCDFVVGDGRTGAALVGLVGALLLLAALGAAYFASAAAGGSEPPAAH
jgi:hypothetical protein